MTHRRVVAADLVYDFAPDDQPLLAERDWALATAQVIDDIAGAALTVPFRVRIVLPGVQEEVAQDGTRVRRTERGITVKHGRDGTFALVARPWVRFTPFGVPANLTVTIEAEGFIPFDLTFPVTYDTRTIAVGPTVVGDLVVTLNSNGGIVAGQTLLFGPANDPQYVRVRAVGAGNQVTLEAGLRNIHNPADPVFPDVFTSPPTVIAAMRRRPVTIAGRVVVRDTTTNTTTGVPNASVTVTDFWRTRAAIVANSVNGSMTDPVPALRQFAVAVTPATLTRRTVGGTADTLALASVADDRMLAQPAVAGDAWVWVDRRQNLLPLPGAIANRLLRIDADDPSAAEYQTVAIIQPPGTPSDPAQLTLEFPLANSHPEGARIERIDPGVLPLPPLPLALMDDVAAGDRCLFFDAPPAAPPPAGLRLAGGGAAEEYQTYAELSVQTDGDGYYRLPPIHRMARVALTVDDGFGNVLPPIDVDPAYGEAEQRVDAVYFV